MYRILVLLVLSYHVLSQPLTDELPARHIRELIECCPCPDSTKGDQDMLAGRGQLAREDSLDDCPCRPRSADSEGESSIFFPSAVRADEPLLRPTDSKEDPKNLLEPEVALATSMLDTLRVATEEEYQEALAREATRNAEEDTIPEESARNVVIVVNPRDSDEDNDMISEASHVQESRCIHPLESMSSDRMRSSIKPINLLPETLKFPKLKRPGFLHRNLMGNDLGASNEEESNTAINKNVQRFQLRTPTSKITTPLKSTLDNCDDANSFRTPSPKISTLKETETSFLKNERFPLFHQLKPNNNDLSSLPSDVQQQLEIPDDKTSQSFKNTKLPLNLKNLLKLKDVELIPKSIRNKPSSKPRLNMSKFAIPTFLKKNEFENSLNDNCNEELQNDKALENIVRQQSAAFNPVHKLITPFNTLKESSKLNKNNLEVRENETAEGEQETIDSLPSPSLAQPSVIKVDNEETTEAAVLAADPSEKLTNCMSLESQELADSIQLSEIQSESKEMEKWGNTFANPGKILSKPTLPAPNQINEHDLPFDNEAQNQVLNSITNIVTEEKKIDTISHNLENHEKDIESSCAHDTIEITPTNLDKTLKDKTSISSTKSFQPLSKTLSNLREDIVKQMENLKKPSTKLDLLKMSDKKDKVSIEGEDEHLNKSQNQNLKKEEVNHRTELNSEDTDNLENKKTKSHISMNDLQDMSDKLLDTNLKKQDDNSLSQTAEFEKKTENFKINSNYLESEIDNKSSETKLDLINTEKDVDDGTNNSYVDKIVCPSYIDHRNINESGEKSFKSVNQEAEQKEMDTGASDTVVKTLPGILDPFNFNSKLHMPILEKIVVQPKSDPLNLLGKPLGDVLNLKTNMPTLNDLRDRLANIFNTGDRSVEDDSSSFEITSSNEPSVETMAPEASTIFSKKKLPSLKQLEDYNMDVFHKPLVIDTLSKTPRLNLNSYRTKVPVPSTLDLKPIKMEPRFSNRAGIDIPSLTSDKMFAHKGKTRNPLERFATLDELRNTLRSNTKNLLDNPVNPDLNIFTENLRSEGFEDISRNIHQNTQNTMKGIQQKIKSSLRKTKVKNSFDDPFAKPQDLLEDMNDKLKAIHYDLNDRLENIMDSSRDQIRSLVDQPRKTSTSKNVMTNLRQNKAKSAPSRLQSAAIKIITQEVDPEGHETKQRDFILGTKPNNFINTVWNESYKTQTEQENIPPFASNGKPKSMKNSLQSNLENRPGMRQNPTIANLLNERPLSTFNRESTINAKDYKSPIFRSAIIPFNDHRQPNKVTISPILPPRPVSSKHNPSISANVNGLQARESLKPVGDSRVSPTQFKPFRSSAPVPSSFDEELEDIEDNFYVEKNPSTNSYSRSLIRDMPNFDTQQEYGSLKIPKAAKTIGSYKETGIKSLVQPSMWPEVSEKTFLNKVRDAVTMRLSSLDSKPVEDFKTEQLDMLRSPSENTDVVLNEPLKENVSYKCKMVCTKEIR